MKKIFATVLVFCLLSSSHVFAEGEVILDLNNGRAETQKEAIPDLVEKGRQYIEDVKEYNLRLDGKNIDKDFAEDIRSKYPQFSEQSAQEWQKYVRKGVKTYRAYEEIKRRLVSWLMKQEVPLVLDDDQYEMGEAEGYVESDKPLVIHDFKKVVAYSNQTRDKLSASEKYAKDHGLPRPSQIIAKYKKAFLEKDWATLFGVDWRKKLWALSETPDAKSDEQQKGLKSTILSKFDGIDDKGKIVGTIELEPENGKFVLLNDYKDYQGLHIDFKNSENIGDVTVHFVMPQQIKAADGRSILGYASRFPVYFEAEAKDVKQPVKFRPVISANICSGEDCRLVTLKPELDLSVKEKIKETVFSTYVSIVAQNIPQAANQKKFKFKNLIFEKGDDDKAGVLRLEVETDKAMYFQVFMFGEASQYFEVPQIRIDGDKVVARFKSLNPQFNPVGKEIGLWVATSANTQYLHKMIVEEVSILDIDTNKVSLGILGLAFLGGMLLNLMPCVFPVLSLKLLAFSKFGGLNKVNIRRNFTYNSFGILFSFGLIAAGLAVLKATGQVLGWGMQFHNIYFLIFMIWVVVLFLAHVLGLINLRTPSFTGLLLDKYKNEGRWFEFLSGVFLVLLSTPCMAPYLGTAFGVALAGSVADIIAVVCVTGLGLAMPYILFALCPDIAIYLPKPGKWIGIINKIMVALLIVTLFWLISVLSAQVGGFKTWHWIAYILTMYLVVFVRNSAMLELEKENEAKDMPKFRRRGNIVCLFIFAAMVVASIADVKTTAFEHRENIEKMMSVLPEQDEIVEKIKQGRKVLVKVGADWCLTCRYNEAFVFDVDYIKDVLENNNVSVIDIDWTHSNQKVLDFMQQYGRRGLPFYVLFSPKFPDGIVLPEMLNAYELQMMLGM